MQGNAEGDDAPVVEQLAISAALSSSWDGAFVITTIWGSTRCTVCNMSLNIAIVCFTWIQNSHVWSSSANEFLFGCINLLLQKGSMQQQPHWNQFKQETVGKGIPAQQVRCNETWQCRSTLQWLVLLWNAPKRGSQPSNLVIPRTLQVGVCHVYRLRLKIYVHTLVPIVTDAQAQ